MWRELARHNSQFNKMEKLSKAIVVLIRKCLKENFKGIIEFSREDFNEIGFISSQPLAVLMDDDTKNVVNSYGFDYIDILSRPDTLVFINRIEDVSDGNSQKYKMYSYENNEVHSEIIEMSNDNIELSKRINSVMQNREKLLQE